MERKTKYRNLFHAYTVHGTSISFSEEAFVVLNRGLQQNSIINTGDFWNTN